MPTEPRDGEPPGRDLRMPVKSAWRRIFQGLRPILPHLRSTARTTPEIIEDIVRSPHLQLIGALVLFVLAFVKVVSVTVAIALALAWWISVFGIARSSRVNGLTWRLRLVVKMGSAVLLGAAFIAFGRWSLEQYHQSQFQQENRQKPVPLAKENPIPP